MKFRKVALVLAAILAGVFGAAVVQSPALAAWSCPVNNYCLWQDANGSGNRYNWGSEWQGQCVPIGGAWNDIASSGKNQSLGNWKMAVYKDAGCLGGVVSNYSLTQGYMGPGQFMNFTGFWNDTASSFRLYL